MAIKPKVFKKMAAALAKTLEVGLYEVGFAQTEQDIIEAQTLRFNVLFKEGKGVMNDEMAAKGREIDEWDPIAYHVIVKHKKTGDVVGTMRLVSNHRLQQGQCFYTEKAYNLDPLREKYDKLLELSRACVAPGKRGGLILLLIWKFTMRFINENDYDLMLGCASFHSTEYQKHAPILRFLYENNLAPDELMPVPVVDNFINISEIEYDADNLEHVGSSGKRADIPTMLRGYLKIGAKVSETAIIDPVFNTTFLCIYVDGNEMRSSNHVLVTKDEE
ncbi:MAG: GNAT family N-acetyltransferase [Arenicella sp.]